MRWTGRLVGFLALTAVTSLVLLIAAHIAYPAAFVGDIGQVLEHLIIGSAVLLSMIAWYTTPDKKRPCRHG